MKTPGHPSFSKVCVLALMLVSYTDAYIVAAPRAPRVVSGTATFQQEGNMTVINASNRSVINYQGFDIAPNETVRFVQPGATSTVLNRVISPNPTNIFGSLQSNGIVYIVNPYGVYFQNGSVLNVGGIVAAAGHISDSDFTSGRIHFTDLTGDVRNDGVLAADNRIALMGANVVNTGTMTVARGVAMMASGSDIYVGEKGGNIYVQANGAAVASAPAGSVTNSGKVAAPRVLLGAGDMYSTAIVNTGLLQGSNVAVNAGRNGTATVSGRIDASAPTTKKNGGKGGGIAVTGGTVALKAATLDASGVNGGGSVRVGGDFHGGGTLAHSTTTTVDAATTIKADATGAKGDGGTVVLWSDASTRFDGQISARGGSVGGNGGSAEVSSANVLSYNGLTNLLAPGGKTGTLLLDPKNITISGAPDSPATSLALAANFGTSPLDGGDANVTINAGTLGTALGLANLMLEANNNIEFAANVTGGGTSPASGSLTLRAGNSIIFDANVTLTLNGSLTATFNDSGATATYRDGTNPITGMQGAVFNMAGGSSINARSGVTIQGGTLAQYYDGTQVVTSTADANTGAITLTSVSAGSTTANVNSGTISITNNVAPGKNITVSGTLNTTPASGNANGGNITLNSTGTLSLGVLSANGAGTGTGGDISLTGGTGVTLNGTISGGTLTTVGNAQVNLNGGTVTTTSAGGQTYGGAVVLGAPTTLTANQNGPIFFGSKVDSAFSTAQSLTLFTGGKQTFSGAVGTTPLASLATGMGAVALNGGPVDTIGTQNYNGPVTLGADAFLTSTGGGVINLGTVDGPFALTLSTTGTMTFAGAVGTTPLASLTAGTGPIRLNGGTVTTTGLQNYNGNVTLGANTTLTSTQGGAITLGGTVDGAFTLALSTTGTMTLSGAVGATPLTSLTMGSGPIKLNAGTVRTTGAQAYNGNVTLGADTTLTSTGNGNIAFAGTLNSDATARSLMVFTGGQTIFGGLVGSGSALSSLTTDNANVTGEATQINGGGITTTGAQNYGDPVTLGATTVLNGGSLSFGKTLDGAQTLTINTAGTTTFNDRVGGINPLLSLTIGSATGNLGGTTVFNVGTGTAVTTVNDGSAAAGAQTYNDNVQLEQGTTLASTVGTNQTNGGAITFNGTITNFGATQENLTLIAGSGQTLIGTGAAFHLDGLSIDGALVTFTKPLGTTTSLLNFLTVTANGTGARSIDINNGGYSTTTGQTYLAPVFLTANTSLDDDGGADISFALTVDSDSATTPRSLNVTTTGGHEDFNGSVGSIFALNRLSTGGGTARLGSTLVSAPALTINTNGGQTYNDNVILRADTTMNVANAENVFFFSPLNSDAATTPRSLTVNSPGDEVFEGRVGNTAPLYSLRTDAAGTVGGSTSFIMTIIPLGAGVAPGVTLGAGGIATYDSTVFNVTNGNSTATPAILVLGNGTQIYSIGSSSYSASTTISQSTVIVGTNLTATPATATYTSGGAITFAGPVKGNTGAENLTIYTGSGGAVNRGSINVGEYDPAPAAVAFDGDVSKLNVLRLVVNGGAPAPTNPPNPGPSPAPGGPPPAPGPNPAPGYDINGDVSTGGAQNYPDPTFLSQDVTLTSTGGGNITFAGLLNSLPSGYYKLTINTTGSEIFNGQVGGITPLRNLTINSGTTIFNYAGTTAFPSVTTINNGAADGGVQEYYSRVLLNANTVLTSTYTSPNPGVGGNIIFHNTVDSSPGGPARSLELNTSADEIFEGRVGGNNTGVNNPLLSLVTDADSGNRGGRTIFNVPGGATATPTVTTSGLQTYNDDVRLQSDTVLFSRGGGDITFNLTVASYSPSTLSNLEVNTAGNELFGDNVGAGTLPLLSLTTDADPAYRNGFTIFGQPGATAALTVTTQNNGGTRGGTQTFNDRVMLNVDTTLTSNAGTGQTVGGNITFNSTVDTASTSLSLRGLTVKTGALTIFNGVVGNTTPLLSLTTDNENQDGEATLINGGTGASSGRTVTTAGFQTYGDAVRLGNDAVLKSLGGADITFQLTVDSDATATPRNLTVNTLGNEFFSGSVGAKFELASLTTDADAPASNPNRGTAYFGVTGTPVVPITVNTVNNGSANTTGTQTFNDAVVLNTDVTFNSIFRGTATAGGNLTFNQTVNGTHKAVFNTTADEYFEGLVGNTDPLLSLTTDAAGGVGGTAHFDMDAGNQAVGFAGVRVAGNGITINDAAIFNVRNSTLANPSVLVYGNGTQTYNGAVTLSLNTFLVGSDSLMPPTTTAYTGGGAILFASTVTGSVPPTPNLTIYTGAGLETYKGTVNVNTFLPGGAAVTFLGNVSGIDTLQTVANPTTGSGGTPVTPGPIDVNNNVTTANGQTYNAAVVLSTNVLLTANTGNVLFTRTLDSDASGTYSLTINTPGGASIFNGFVGGNKPLLSLATGAAQINGKGVTTTGGQTYGGAVTLGNDAVLTAGGDVRFASTLDGAYDLTVNTPGDEYFEGLVGSQSPLMDLTVDGFLGLGGTTHFDMTVGNAVAGVNVTNFVTINNSVIFNAANASLNHPTVLAGIEQTYGSPDVATAATLQRPTFLQSAVGATGTSIDTINFLGTVDGPFDLTLNSLGNEAFDGVVGGIAPLASLTIDNLYNPTHTADSGSITKFGTTFFGMAQPATGAGVNVSGAITINDQVEFVVRGSSVTDPAHPSVLTGGAQTYYSLATVERDTSLRSSGGADITFNSAVSGPVTNPYALAIFTTGQKIFNGGVGAPNALGSLTTSAGGATQINGNIVNTTGFQTYNSPVLLGTSPNATPVALGYVTLSSSGGSDITFNSTVDGARDLFISTAGNEVFNGRVGGTTSLSSLRIDTRLDPVPTPLGTGQTIFNVAGGSPATPTVTTTGLQIYNDPVVLSQNTFLTSTGGGTITFNTTVDGAGALTLATTGAMTFNGAVGNTTPLASLLAGGGPINLNGMTVKTAGGQTYNGAVLLGVDTTLTSSGAGDIRFASTLDGKQRLFVNTAGQTIFDSPVGGGTALVSLATDAAGSTLIDGGSVVTTDYQAYGDALTAASAGTTFLQDTAGNVMLLGPVTVAGSRLQVNATRILAHDITATGGGHDLDLEATRLLLLAGNTYDLSGGTISLNTNTTSSGTLGDGNPFNGKATIVLVPGGNGTTAFRANNFSMGYLQSMLAFGTVNINATSGATLSSIAASGDLNVNSPSITLLSAPETTSLQGRRVGLTFAAIGLINFGNGAIRFSRTTGRDVDTAGFFTTSGAVSIQRVPGVSLFADSGLPSQFGRLPFVNDYRAVARTSADDPGYSAGDLSGKLTNLNPTGLDTLTGNQFLDIAAALAGALPLLNRDLDLPSDGLAVTAAQLEQLKKLGINPRLAERNERSSIRDKRALFAQLVDAEDTESYGRLQPIKGAVSRLVPSDFVVVVDRMSGVEVQSILQAFEQVYGKDQGKVPDISAKLQTAYVDFVTEQPKGSGNGHEFAAYVQKHQAKYGDINGTVRDFDNLFGRLEGLGLTDAEVAKSEEHIVHAVQPTGLSDGETRRFINDLRKGLPPGQRAPSNSQPPSAPAAHPAPDKVKGTPPQGRTARRQKPDAVRQANRAPAPADASHAVAGL